eukprot:SAG31_NODE_2541_length_5536_cov_2.014162_6_plen_150_part_01
MVTGSKGLSRISPNFAEYRRMPNIAECRMPLLSVLLALPLRALPQVLADYLRARALRLCAMLCCPIPVSGRQRGIQSANYWQVRVSRARTPQIPTTALLRDFLTYGLRHCGQLLALGRQCRQLLRVLLAALLSMHTFEFGTKSRLLLPF